MSTRKGPISQRSLVKLLVPLIDAAMAPNSTAHRDIARSELRALLNNPEVAWRTIWVLRSLNPKRCRYLASLGYPIPSRHLWREYKGVEERTDD